MYFVASALTILSGLFYAASRHEIGSFGVAMCQYGSPFCDNPLLVLTAAGLAALWQEIELPERQREEDQGHQNE